MVIGTIDTPEVLFVLVSQGCQTMDKSFESLILAGWRGTPCFHIRANKQGWTRILEECFIRLICIEKYNLSHIVIKLSSTSIYRYLYLNIIISLGVNFKALKLLKSLKLTFFLSPCLTIYPVHAGGAEEKQLLTLLCFFSLLTPYTLNSF
jgi:hypothetical protein